MRDRLEKLERSAAERSMSGSARLWGRFVTPPNEPCLNPDDLPADATAGQRRMLLMVRLMDKRTVPEAVTV